MTLSDLTGFLDIIIRKRKTNESKIRSAGSTVRIRTSEPLLETKVYFPAATGGESYNYLADLVALRNVGR